ncbi:4-hydroxythreonine-4-phosphate dehydrogenase PdxA [Candidatus Pelagibacter sp.]|nr:4-hydroxythreonine-4-phosphate dehydrogenase PdxA [Candidatus Pelagibacter sp.]
MLHNKKPIIVISGEPYSTFLEIFFKVIKSSLIKKIKRPIILISSKKIIELQMKKLNFNFQINLISKDDILKNKLNNNCINLINVNLNFKKPFGKISSKSNFFIKECFDIALELMKKKKGCGIINGPISKQHFLGKKYLGITEYIANKTLSKNNEVMLIFNKSLAVSPITTHIPLKDVNKKITINKIIKKVCTINKFYKERFNKVPKFAITGLNPHCESNYNNSEEEKIIKPALKLLNKKRINIIGPFPADTIFLKNNLKNFNIIIGMYHDQVLAPYKTLYEFDAINITLGLPFIRVSPDHGPNTKMLGKNISNSTSFQKALVFLNT